MLTSLTKYVTEMKNFARQACLCVCLNGFNVRQHYKAIQTIGHSSRSTPTNGLRFTVFSLPWKFIHPITNRGRPCLTSMNEPYASVATVNTT